MLIPMDSLWPRGLFSPANPIIGEMSAGQAIVIDSPLLLLLPGGRQGLPDPLQFDPGRYQFGRHHLVVDGTELALAQSLLEFRLLGCQFGRLLFERKET